MTPTRRNQRTDTINRVAALLVQYEELYGQPLLEDEDGRPELDYLLDHHRRVNEEASAAFAEPIIGGWVSGYISGGGR